MLYNPIFEEEMDKKHRRKLFRDLKKAIKRRARKHNLKKAIGRVYKLLRKTSLTTLTSIFDSEEKELLKNSK